MKKQINKFIVSTLIGICVISCATITVNIYFPAEAVEKAAEEIINEIESGDESETEIDKNNLQSYFPINTFGYVWSNLIAYNSIAYADEIDLNLTSPAIRKVINAMKSRNAKIKSFKNSGAIGENADGLLAIRDLSNLAGEEIRTVKRLLKADNNDRKTLYNELATANKITLSGVDRISKVFAKTRKAKLKKGQWYKDKEGNWEQK
ncbi:MAG: YdbL family protein [Candidatus Anammoxibacter sp.]